jgi:hypothetical protein
LIKVHSSKVTLGTKLNFYKPWVENISTDTSFSRLMVTLK